MITKVINVNLHQPIYERLTAKQGDIASRYLLFHLLDGDKPLDLNNRTVRVYAIKPDKTEIFNDLVINDKTKGYCTLELTSQCLAEAGIVKMELYITELGKVLTSIPFELEVIACINTVNSVTSTNEFSALEAALRSLQDFDNFKNEIIEARGSENSLGDRINLVESDVSNLNSEVSNLNSEVDRINDSFNIVDKNGDIFSLYNSVPQGSVIHVLGEIDCLSKKLILNKPIKIVGLSKDATLKNTSIEIQSSDVFLSNFKIKTTMDNGVACNSGSCKNIRLYDIDSEAVAHSFLFENYNGIVEDVVLENCTARNSINGFISKSGDVSFINCKSYGCGLNFGLVSDNIPSATQVANCERSNIINCCAIGGSYGLHLYCRDKYNTDCVPRNRNNRIVNFTVKDCAYPIQVGEDVLYTGYKSFKEIEQAIFENIIVDGGDNGEWSILLSHGKRCSFNNCSLNNKIQQVSAYQCVMSNILVKSENYVGRNIVNIDNSNAVIDASMYNAVEVQYNANNNNTINLINGPNSAGLINVFIRTKGANGVSFGGFGSNIIDDNNILKTLNYNEGQNITFAFIEGVQKFIPILVKKNIKYA